MFIVPLIARSFFKRHFKTEALENAYIPGAFQSICISRSFIDYIPSSIKKILSRMNFHLWLLFFLGWGDRLKTHELWDKCESDFAKSLYGPLPINIYGMHVQTRNMRPHSLNSCTHNQSAQHKAPMAFFICNLVRSNGPMYVVQTIYIALTFVF